MYEQKQLNENAVVEADCAAETQIAIEASFENSADELAKGNQKGEAPADEASSAGEAPVAKPCEPTEALESAEELPSPTASSPEEKTGALAEKLDALARRFDAVEGGAEALRKAVTGFYTQTTDSMHKELEKFRKGLLRKLEQELFGELIDLYDVADRAVASVAGDPTKAQSLLEGIRDQIDAALFNRGVERREAVVGEKFDGRRHHLARPDILTGDIDLDGTVAATAKPGFDDMDESFRDLRGGCMKLRPIHVRLYKFDPALAATTPAATDEPIAVEPTSDAEAPEATSGDAVEQGTFTSGPEVQSCFSQQT